MNCLFITYGLDVGGAETILVKLLNHFHREKITPFLASLGKSGDLESTLSPDIELKKMPRRWRFDMNPERQIASLIQEKNIQTVFALDFFSFFFVHRATSLVRWPVHTIISLHATKPHRIKDYLMTMAYARLLKGDEILLTVCKAQANYLSRLYHINRSQFGTIYNGVDPEYWSPAPSSFDARTVRLPLGILPEAVVIVQVAVFRREKNQFDSVQALAELGKRFNRFPFLLFVGGGEQKMIDEVRILAERLHVAERVKFCGQQTDVRPFLWSSDLFTLSSKTETFPMAALEAMSVGLPCALPDLGGARELVQDGINGFIARPHNPMLLAESWARSIEHHATLPPGAIREIVKNKFSFEQCLRLHEELLTSGGKKASD